MRKTYFLSLVGSATALPFTISSARGKVDRRSVIFPMRELDLIHSVRTVTY